MATQERPPYVVGPSVDNTLGGRLRPAASLADRVMAVVATEGPFHSVEDLRRSVRDPGERLSLTEVAGTVHALGRAAKVHTRRRGENHFTLIEATKMGYRAANVPERPVGAPVGHTGGLPSLRPGDPTDYHNHGPRAEGGPIETIRLAPPLTTPDGFRARFEGDGHVIAAAVDSLSPEKAWATTIAVASMEGCSISALAKALRLTDAPVAVRVRKAVALGWLQMAGTTSRRRLYLTAEARDRLNLPAAPEPKPAQTEPARNGVEWPSPEHRALSRGGVHTPAPTLVSLRAEMERLPAPQPDYPAIAELLRTSGEVADMAAKLESMGFLDEAISVLNRLDNLSPLEREVLRMVREKGVTL